MLHFITRSTVIRPHHRPLNSVLGNNLENDYFYLLRKAYQENKNGWERNQCHGHQRVRRSLKKRMRHFRRKIKKYRRRRKHWIKYKTSKLRRRFRNIKKHFDKVRLKVRKIKHKWRRLGSKVKNIRHKWQRFQGNVKTHVHRIRSKVHDVRHKWDRFYQNNVKKYYDNIKKGMSTYAALMAISAAG